MEANTTTAATTVTQTIIIPVQARKSVVPKTPGKLGRKPTAVTEITTKDFTIVDLGNANSTVKSPTVRAFVARNLASGRYTIVGTFKSGGRGKPANIYRINKTA